jgi:hypothetical protein
VVSKLVWQKVMRNATDLSHVEFRVLMMISTYTGPDNTGATMATSRISAHCDNKDHRWTKRVIRSLIDKGYLRVAEQGGKYAKDTNTYDVLIPPWLWRVWDTTHRAEMVEGAGSTGWRVPQTPMEGVGSTGWRVPQTPQSESLSDLHQKKASSGADASASAGSDGFESFIKAMPFRAGSDERKARAAYDHIITGGESTAEELLALAKRYKRRTEEQNHQADRICFPANWLSKGNWRDYRLRKVFAPWGDEVLREVEQWRLDKEHTGPVGFKGEW